MSRRNGVNQAQAEARAARERLAHSLGELREEMRRQTDVKSRVAADPRPLMIVAFILGFVLGGGIAGLRGRKR